MSLSYCVCDCGCDESFMPPYPHNKCGYCKDGECLLQLVQSVKSDNQRVKGKERGSQSNTNFDDLQQGFSRLRRSDPQYVGEVMSVISELYKVFVEVGASDDETVDDVLDRVEREDNKSAQLLHLILEHLEDRNDIYGGAL